jgi:hypothetical protein
MVVPQKQGERYVNTCLSQAAGQQAAGAVEVAAIAAHHSVVVEGGQATGAWMRMRAVAELAVAGDGEASRRVFRILRRWSAVSSSPISAGTMSQIEFSIWRYNKVRCEPVMTDTLEVMKCLVTNTKLLKF